MSLLRDLAGFSLRPPTQTLPYTPHCRILFVLGVGCPHQNEQGFPVQSTLRTTVAKSCRLAGDGKWVFTVPSTCRPRVAFLGVPGTPFLALQASVFSPWQESLQSLWVSGPFTHGENSELLPHPRERRWDQHTHWHWQIEPHFSENSCEVQFLRFLPLPFPPRDKRWLCIF